MSIGIIGLKLICGGWDRFYHLISILNLSRRVRNFIVMSSEALFIRIRLGSSMLKYPYLRE